MNILELKKAIENLDDNMEVVVLDMRDDDPESNNPHSTHVNAEVIEVVLRSNERKKIKVFAIEFGEPLGGE